MPKERIYDALDETHWEIEVQWDKGGDEAVILSTHFSDDRNSVKVAPEDTVVPIKLDRRQLGRLKTVIDRVWGQMTNNT